MDHERFYHKFKRPPFAPIYRPTAEEFSDPIAYVAKIRPDAEQYGVIKIVPPETFKPPFAINMDDFEFTPRIQRLNEIDALVREKLFFCDQLVRFWTLQGVEFKTPLMEGKYLDLYQIYHAVHSLGGADAVTKNKQWSSVAKKAGFKASQSPAKIKEHYYNIIMPYLKVFEEHLKTAQVDYDDEDDKDKKDILTDCKESMQGVRRPRQQGRMMAGFAIPKKKAKAKAKRFVSDPMENVFCGVCQRGDDEDKLLLCEGCDKSMHTTCCEPPLKEVPKGEWRCPTCVISEMTKCDTNFGFYDANSTYTITSFTEYANNFKKEFFKCRNARDVSIDVVEAEFWKHLIDPNKHIDVKYGADLITSKVGSGFPRKCDDHRGQDGRQKMHYASHAWNLNNLPVLKESVLSHIETGISGMMVPWVYVGMCFSTFCWHTEDHWTYSINYNHWGEPKIWYGISGDEAEKFENVVRDLAPNLTGMQKDIFHHMTTAVNPNILISKGVNVYTVHQNEGEFVITFPRAYHAGFNEGINFAEAVNFAPIDWLRMGRQCITDYSLVRRPCVFSHDELVIKMVSASDKLGIAMSLAALDELLMMCQRECKGRNTLKKRGVTISNKENFHEIVDDQRVCRQCNTTLFLSALTCAHDKSVCLDHIDFLCNKCPFSECVFKFSYTMDDLEPMVKKLKERTTLYFEWADEVTALFERPNKPVIDEVQALIESAKQKKFPTAAPLVRLTSATRSCQGCLERAQTLLNGKVRTRKETRIQRADTRLSVDDVKRLIEEMQNLPCNVEAMLLKVESKYEQYSEWQKEAKEAVMNCSKQDDFSTNILTSLIERGEEFDIRLDELEDLRRCIRGRRWVKNAKDLLAWESTREMESDDDFLSKERWKLDHVLKLLKDGAEFVRELPSTGIIDDLHARYKMAVQMDNSADSLRSSNNTTVDELEALWETARESDWCSAKGMDWMRREIVQARLFATEEDSDEVSLADLSRKIDKCQKSTILSSTNIYKERREIRSKLEQFTSRLNNMFMKPTSYHSLSEILRDRDDIVSLIEGRQVPLSLHHFEAPIHEWDFIAECNSSSKAKDAILSLRDQRRRLLGTLQKLNEKRNLAETCVCLSEKSDNHIVACLLCRAKFHVSCCDWDSYLGTLPEGSFLCIRCLKSRRPCIEDVEVACNIAPANSVEVIILKELVSFARTTARTVKELVNTIGTHTNAEWTKEVNEKVRRLIEDVLSIEILDIQTMPKVSMLVSILYADLLKRQKSACLVLRDTPVRSEPIEVLFCHSAKKAKNRKPNDGDGPKRKRPRGEVHSDQEHCAFKKCLKPSGKQVGWVQCEDCSNWYHLVCVGLTIEAVKSLKEYTCDSCKICT